MTTNDQKTLAQFIEQHGLSMRVEWTDANPDMDDSAQMDHWKCRIRKGSRSMSITFSMGVGLGSREPELAEVLDCLASDASGVENARSFEDWCGDYGYDTDSRKAERTYKTIERQAEKMKSMLGDEAYADLLWNIERQ